jgi:protein Mpv17
MVEVRSSSHNRPSNDSHDSLAIFGPLATTWFGFLQRRVVFPGRPNTEILARVGLDQAILAPGNLFLFLNTMALMEGTSAKEKLDTTYWPALSRNWMVWPIVQFINFKYVPLELRVLVVNVVSLGWNCYLSYLNGQSKPSDEEEPPFA